VLTHPCPKEKPLVPDVREYSHPSRLPTPPTAAAAAAAAAAGGGAGAAAAAAGGAAATCPKLLCEDRPQLPLEVVVVPRAMLALDLPLPLFLPLVNSTLFIPERR
jgi:hypothetical protein